MSFNGGPLKHERSSKAPQQERASINTEPRNIPEHEKIKMIFMKKNMNKKNYNNEIIFVKTKKQTKKEKETGIISPSDDFLGLFQTPDMTLNVLRD